MKKISLLFLFFAIALPFQFIYGQGFTLGVRGGISIPNLTAGGSESNPLNEGYKSRIGPDVAIFGEYHISSAFSIEAMLEYSSQGGKKNGMQAFPNPEGDRPLYLYANFKSEAKLNYLLLPILARYNWKPGSGPWNIYVDAGPFAGILLSAHQETSGSSVAYLDEEGQQPATPSPIPFNANNDIKDQLNTFNFGVSGNLGIAYHLASSQIFIEGGGNYGFLNIQKGTANGKNHTGAGTVAVGYGITLGK